MLDASLLFLCIFSFYLIQRCFELYLNYKNEKILIQNFHAYEYSRLDSIRVKMLHILWFLSWFLESTKNGRISLFEAVLILLVMSVCQIVRISSIRLLGIYWTIKIYKMDHQKVIKSGMYRYLRHPNYLIVVFEVMLLPMLFKAYFTSMIFTFLNFIIIKKRIEVEEEVLSSQSNYKNEFKDISRLIIF